jgi:hypothetical protein
MLLFKGFASSSTTKQAEVQTLRSVTLNYITLHDTAQYVDT